MADEENTGSLTNGSNTGASNGREKGAGATHVTSIGRAIVGAHRKGDRVWAESFFK